MNIVKISGILSYKHKPIPRLMTMTMTMKLFYQHNQESKVRHLYTTKY